MISRTVAAFSALLVARCHADHRAACSVLTSARMDPIVAPLALASHHHQIAGSAGFATVTNFDWMRKNHSSCSIVGDHSNYWAPTVYHVSTYTGTVTELNASFIAYYLSGRSEGGNAELAANFPFNLSMITHKSQKQCRTPSGGFVGFNTLPDDGTCVGLRLSYSFPNCWNGRHYSADQSHVTYAKGYRVHALGECPATHPHKIFSLRLEHNIQIPEKLQTWKGRPKFTLSSQLGTWGFDSAHADATLLWNRNVIVAIADKCALLKAQECDTLIKAEMPETYLSADARIAVAESFVVPKRFSNLPVDTIIPPF